MHDREEPTYGQPRNGHRSCCDTMFVDYTNEDITQSRWAPRWLLATTRFLSFLLLALVTAFQHHPSYSASLFVTYGLSLSYFLLAIAPLLEGKKKDKEGDKDRDKVPTPELPESVSVPQFGREETPDFSQAGHDAPVGETATCNLNVYPPLTGFLYSFFAVLNSYLLVDFLRMWVHWGTWNFHFWWDLYLPADLISVALIFLLYATDTLVMHAKIRLSYRYGLGALGVNAVAFTAVYAANTSNRKVFRNNPGVIIAIWIAHQIAYLLLTLGIVGLSRIRWCCYEEKLLDDADADADSRNGDVENQT